MVMQEINHRNSPNLRKESEMEVIYRTKREVQRVRDELKNIPSARANSVTEQTHRTIVTVYHAGSAAPSDKGYGGGPDPVAAAIAAKGGIQR
jgi:hypothetical protein